MTVADEEARAARRRGGLLPQPLPVSALAEDRVLGGVSVRVFTPPAARGVYLHLHGGGFVYGSSRLQDDRLEALAVGCGLTVVSVDYRLAPEAPYPAAPHDCEAVALRLVERGEPLCIGGESAGANLALVTLLRLRDRHGFTGMRTACLIKGVYDLTRPPADRSLGELLAAYAGAHDLALHDLSPLHADLSTLPPALVAVGGDDALLGDSCRLAQRWRAAGNEVELAIVPGAGHELEPVEQVHAFLTARVT